MNLKTIVLINEYFHATYPEFLEAIKEFYSTGEHGENYNNSPILSVKDILSATSFFLNIYHNDKFLYENFSITDIYGFKDVIREQCMLY